MYYLISNANKKNHLLLQEHTLEIIREKRGSEIDSSNPASRRCFSFHPHSRYNEHFIPISPGSTQVSLVYRFN